MRRAILALLLLSSLGSRPLAALPLELSSYQVGFLAALQSGGDSFTGELAWTPLLDLGPVGVRAELGLTLLKNALADRFIALTYEAHLRLPVVAPITLEMGGGAQTWTAGNGGTQPIVSLGLSFALGMNLLDRIYASYSRFFITPAVSELRLGVGLMF